MTPLGNFPAGYDLRMSVWVAGGKFPILSTIWLVPGGAPVYCHAAVPDALAVHSETFWENIVANVREHVQNRPRHVSVFKDMALSDNPPTDGAIHGFPQPTTPALLLFAERDERSIWTATPAANAPVPEAAAGTGE